MATLIISLSLLPSMSKAISSKPKLKPKRNTTRKPGPNSGLEAQTNPHESKRNSGRARKMLLVPRRQNANSNWPPPSVSMEAHRHHHTSSKIQQRVERTATPPAPTTKTTTTSIHVTTHPIHDRHPPPPPARKTKPTQSHEKRKIRARIVFTTGSVALVSRTTSSSGAPLEHTKNSHLPKPNPKTKRKKIPIPPIPISLSLRPHLRPRFLLCSPFPPPSRRRLVGRGGGRIPLLSSSPRRGRG